MGRLTLVDKDGEPVEIPDGEKITVKLQYKPLDGTNVKDDDFVNSRQIEVTLDNSVKDNEYYKVQIQNQTKVDFDTEGTEKYKLEITGVSQEKNTYENITIDSKNSSVTGTILDGISLGTPVDATVYEDGLNNSSDNTENSSNNSLGITNPNNDAYTVSFDKTITTTIEKSNGQTITYSYNESGTILTAKRTDGKTVFTVELKKDDSGKDVYDFKLLEPMDHTYGDNIKDTFDMTFNFNVTSNGTKSDNVPFIVTVVDSVPNAEPIIANTKEDKAVIVRLADDDFKAGEPVTINGATHNIGETDIAIYEQGDATKQIGSLKINTNGTVTFTPIEDYSNHDTTKSPQFTYTVKDFDGDEASSTVTINVKPVADAPVIVKKDVNTTEDAGNTQEGSNKIGLELKVPYLSKDSDRFADTTVTPNIESGTGDQNIGTGTGDQNIGTGDNPERNGEITLTFTNGDKVTGAKIFKEDGTTQVGNEITTANQTLKVVIVKTVGGIDIDYDYHHADITTSNPSGAIYLTQAEYESLKIQHAEDNDTDIKIGISVTSYELDDSGKLLTGNLVTLYTTTRYMTVKINPVTDDINLIFDTATDGTITKTYREDDTFTFTSKIQEGSGEINLNSILSNTSGGIGATPDLDGSEKRTYTISGIPEGTVVTLGGQTAVANASSVATIVFNNTNNQAADPDFSMKFPENYSGTVNAKITLNVIDKGNGTEHTNNDGTEKIGAGGQGEWGEVKTAEVYFNVVVNPIADIATIQVKQAIGYEDAGRGGDEKNQPKTGDILENGKDGIPLDIKVSSDDKDGSETFNVTISELPDDGVIYYNGGLYDKNGFVSGTNNANVSVDNSGTGWAITIEEYDNDILPKFIPPHNDDTDYTLKVSAKTIDGTNVAAPTVTTIDVIVKNVADAPVGTELKTDIKVDEDNQLNLKDVYTDSTALKSYDDSEVLTVKIDFKDTGITIATGTPFYIEDGMYVVKASDITNNKIMLNIPKDFSGNTTFDLTYVTTEKAGEGDSKTWDTDTVSIFVNPIADNVVITTSSTIYEDADGSANKLNLKPTLIDDDTDGEETITAIKFLASEVPAGYKLYSDAGMTTEITTTEISGTNYYVLTATQADSVYVKNTTLHDADSGDNFSLNVIYTVTDTNGSESDTKDFSHTHAVNVKAVTDAPTLTVGDITQVSGTVTIDNGTDNGTDTVTVNADNSEFNVAVTTSSDDKDGSETVQKIVISGVPTGVSIEGATYYGYSGSKANGIWVITAPANSALNADGALENIKFKINSGADFEDIAMTITTYTKDIDAEIESASQTINIVKGYTPTGTEPGNPADLELVVKTADITEDTEFNLADVLGVNLKSGGSEGNGGAVITFTDIPAGSTVSGYDYSYEQDEKTHYVVTGNGNVADMNTQLADVKITTPEDMNSDQDGDLKGNFTFTANIVTHHNGGFKNGNQVTAPETTQNIAPLTDEMTISVTADNINEDATSNLSITLSNPSDGTKTELVGSSLTITVTETWADTLSGAIDEKGELWYNGSKLTPNGDGTYTIPLDAGYVMGSDISGLSYKPANNRDGNVKFEVSVQNKETGSEILPSTGKTNIKVTPVIDVVIDTSVVTETGTEDLPVTVGSTTLGNSVILEITTVSIVDGSESFGNIILDRIPNGFTVWYKDGTELKMATNIGESTGLVNIYPNLGTGTTFVNQWMVPQIGDGNALPKIYINAPTNWAGDFNFDATFKVKEQHGSFETHKVENITGKITPVADGVTIAPTLTFGDAFSWLDLKLNANMKDVDGSEVMNLELTRLSASSQFRIEDGAVLDNKQAVWDEANSKWTISGIKFDEIGKIQFTSDKDVTSVGVNAWTQEIDKDGNNVTTDKNNTKDDSSILNQTGSFNVDVKEISGNFTLDKGINLDFSKLDNSNIKNITSIDLGVSNGKNELLNLKLSDVLGMTNSSKELIIKGNGDDKVSFKNEDGQDWKKLDNINEGGKTYLVYSNQDESLKVKVENTIVEQVIII